MIHPVVRPALAYVLTVFAAAFLLGSARVLWVAPAFGALGAVALEVPIILMLSWVVAGAVLSRWPLSLPARLGMGALAFAILMALEAALARAFGTTASAWIAAMATPAGALGLAGQIGFALIPAVRPQARG